MNITERLKNLREEKNLRIYDISEFLKIDKDLYGKYERQNVIIPIKHLINVSEYFDASLDYIFNYVMNWQKGIHVFKNAPTMIRN